MDDTKLKWNNRKARNPHNKQLVTKEMRVKGHNIVKAGIHCLVKVAQSCPTLSNPMVWSPPGSSIHGIFQARILKWVVMPFSRGSSQPRDWTQVSCIASGFFTVWATTLHSVQFSSVAQSCPTLWDPMNRSTPGLPVYHQLLEFTQTHAHRVSDAIQPSHPLSSPSPPAPNPSQHQSLFQWVNPSHEVTKVLEFQL